ncbi:MAG TPA: AMP-binding protein, partial [Gammaproteobacteria bacterium]|nr:AMP-binding protein [Gammaproteobacteria bacterium]
MAVNRNKPWLKSYPEGTPEFITLDPRKTIVKLLNEAESSYPENDAFVNFGMSLNYKDVSAQSRKFAAYLQNVLGLRKGDRIAMMMPNLLQYPVAIFGALRAGLIVV